MYISFLGGNELKPFYKWLGVGLFGIMLTTTGCGISKAASPASPTSASSTAQSENNTSSNAIDGNGTQNNGVSTSTGNGLNNGTSTAPANYTNYQNNRYGFSLYVPSNFEQAPPPQDGGGQTWNAQGNAVKIEAFGEFNVNNDTVSSEMASISATMNPTYKDSGTNWFVVTGYNQSNIIYDKVYVGKTNIYELQIEYPKSEQSTYGAIVNTVSASFQPGTLN